MKRTDIEYDYETVTREVPLGNGSVVPLSFKAYGPVINREDADGNPLPPKFMSFDDMWSELDDWERADLITRKLRDQYELGPVDLAKGVLNRLANSATWELGDEVGSVMGAAMGFGEGETFKERQENILKSERAQNELFEALYPTLSSVATGSGVALDPTIVLGGVTPAVRAAAGSVRPAMTTAQGVDLSVLNPATIGSGTGLGQVVEAGAKTGLYTGATNVGMGGEFGEGFYPGAGMGSAAQTLINMVPRTRGGPQPSRASTPEELARQRLIHASRMETSGNRLFPSVGGADPLLRDLQAQGVADAERLGVPVSIPEALGREGSELQIEAARLAPTSGQKVADVLRNREAQASSRLRDEARQQSFPPDTLSAAEAQRAREAITDPIETELRQSAYGQRTTFTDSGVIGTLKAWPAWKELYNSVRNDRKTLVEANKGKPDYNRYWSDGYPKLLPNNFNDFIDGIRYVPPRDYNRLVQQLGAGNLPFQPLRYTKKQAENFNKNNPDKKVKEGDYIKDSSGHYKVELKNRDADYRTLHELRKAYDQKIPLQIDAGKINPEISNPQRNAVDRLIKTSEDMAKHDLSVQTRKSMEDSAKEGAKAAQISPGQRMEFAEADRLFRINDDAPQSLKNATREQFVRSFVDTLTNLKVSAKDILGDPDMKLKINMIFNGLKNQDEAYKDFISRLEKERKMSSQQRAVGERISGTETTKETSATGTALRFLAKIPAYAFSAAFGLQRDFMESFRVVMKEQTKEEAAALNRISTLQPGTKEFAKEVDELAKLYELGKKSQEMKAIKNIGAFMSRLAITEDANYIPGAGAIEGSDKLMEQDFMRRRIYSPVEFVEEAAGNIFDAPYERESIFE